MGYSKKGKQGFQIKHGLKDHPLYRTWSHMKTRCYNMKSPDYKDYGKRGIVVCDLWKDDIVEFFYWSLKNGWKKGLTIERINNNKGYSPDNCKWIPMEEQPKNRRSVRNITYNGETHSLTEWSRITGIARKTLELRLNSPNFTLEEAFEVPVNKKLARR